MSTRPRQHSRRIAGAVAAGLLLCSLLVVFSGSAAEAAVKCPVGHDTKPDGSLDLTGYLQCQFPTVTPNPVAPGGQVEIKAGGFKAGSQVTVTLVCPGRDPVVLGTTTANDHGLVDVTEIIPADTPLGDCKIELSGVDANGNPLTVVLAITIAASGGTLPRTGSDIGQYLGLGVALIALGGAAVWGSRRERAKNAKAA